MRATVIKDGLNVHSAAGAHRPIVDALKQGDVVYYTKVRWIGGYEWYEIGPDRWVYANGLRKDIAPPGASPTVIIASHPADDAPPTEKPLVPGALIVGLVALVIIGGIWLIFG